jgi:TP901 family phage tail tape measure protein
MADEIKLIVRVEGKGVTELKGNVNQLKEAVKQFAREPWISNSQRRQLSQLRTELDTIATRAASTGRVVSSISATAHRANNSSLKVGYSAMGIDTYRAMQTKAMEQESKKQLAIQQKQAQKEAEIAANSAKMRRAAMFGTIGFGGLQVGQQVAGMLDNINFSGSLAPAFNKIFGSLGSMFGDMFGKVFGELASAIGTTAEAVANLLTSALRAAFKAAGSLLSGIAMSLISVGLGGAINVVVGTAVGLLMASLSIIQSILESMVNLFKDFVKIIADLLSAAFNVIKGLFSAFGSIISGIWKGIWEGLKAIAQSAWDVITAISKTAFDQLSKSFEDYAASQKLAARVFSQVNDIAENQGKTMKQGAEQFRGMGMALSEKFAVGLNDATMGLYRITSAGITATDTMKSIADTAGMMSVMSQHEDSFESISNTLVSAAQAYGATGSEINRMGAIISASTKMGRYDLKEFNSGLQAVIGSAAAAQIPFEQLGTILAVTSHAGLNINRVTVGLNRVFDAMTNPTKANSKAFKEMGVNVNELRNKGMSLVDVLMLIMDKAPDEQLRQLFGTVQGTRAFKALRSQLADMPAAMARMNTMIGQFGKNFEDAMSLVSNRMVKTKNAWENFKMSLSGKLFDSAVISGLDILDEIMSGIVSTVTSIDFSPLTKALSEDMASVWNTVKQLPAFLGQVLGISINWNDIVKSVAGYITQISNYLANPKTWEGLVKGAMTAAAYLKLGYEYLKLMTSDTKFFNKMFSSLGDMIKGIGVFLVETFKSAFELSAALAQATFLPVFKDIGNQFGAFLMSSLGDVFSSMSRYMGDMKMNLPKTLLAINPALAALQEGFNATTEGMSGLFGSMGNLANLKSLNMLNPETVPLNQESIFNTLKPILEEAVKGGNKDLITKLAAVSQIVSVPGKEGYPGTDVMGTMNYLEKMLTSSNAEEARKSANTLGTSYITDTDLILNKILFVLTNPKISNVLTTDSKLKNMIKGFGRNTSIEEERRQGREQLGGINFVSDLDKNFQKLQSSLGSIVSTMGADLKNTNPVAYEAFVKQIEEINKIQYKISEENKKAVQENTNALKSNTESKKVTDGMKHTRKLVAASYADTYVSKMKALNPKSEVTSSGIIQTGKGLMSLVDIATPANTNKIVKKGVEEQEKRTKIDSGTQAVVDGVKGVATLNEQMLDELKTISKRSQFWNMSGVTKVDTMNPPMANEGTYQDIYEQN